MTEHARKIYSDRRKLKPIVMHKKFYQIALAAVTEMRCSIASRKTFDKKFWKQLHSLEKRIKTKWVHVKGNDFQVPMTEAQEVLMKFAIEKSRT